MADLSSYINIAANNSTITGDIHAGNVQATNSLAGTDINITGNLSTGGNLDIDGEGRVGGNLNIVGDIFFTGTGQINQVTTVNGVFTGDADGANALYAGTPGFSRVPGSVAQYTGDGNYYLQLNAQNISHGTQASIEYVITGDLGTDTTDYIDLGFSSSSWDGTQENSLGTAVGERDGYLYVQGGGGGGNLVLGVTTPSRNIKFVAGGPNAANIVATINSTGLNVTSNVNAGHFVGEGGNISNIQLSSVTGLGNISSISLDGSSGNVLYGNGVFAPASGGGGYGDSNVTTLLGSYGANTILTTANITGANIIGTSFVYSGTGVYRSSVGGSSQLELSAAGLNVTGNISIGSGGYLKGPGGTSSIQFNAGATGDFKFAPAGNFYVGTSNTGNILAGNLTLTGDVLATGNINANGGYFKTSASTAYIANASATTVNIGGAASLAVNIGNASGVVNLSGNVQGNTNGFAIGYRDIPQLAFAGDTTLALSDAGKHYYSTLSTGNTITVPNNTSVTFSTGTAINIINQGTGTITIAQGVGVTMYLAGNSTSGNRTLASYGVCTLQKVATNTWFLVGVGLT